MPEAQFLLECGPSLSTYRVKRCTAPTSTHAPIPVLGSHKAETKPFWWRSQKGRGLYSKFVYRAASILAEDGDALFVLWGIWYPKEHLIRLAYFDPLGWRSDESFCFCEVYRHRGSQLLSDTSLPDHLWIAKLTTTVSPVDEIVQQLGANISKGSLTTCRQRLKIGSRGRTIQVVAEVLTKEFVGRAMLQIRTTIEALQS